MAELELLDTGGVNDSGMEFILYDRQKILLSVLTPLCLHSAVFSRFAVEFKSGCSSWEELKLYHSVSQQL